MRILAAPLLILLTGCSEGVPTAIEGQPVAGPEAAAVVSSGEAIFTFSATHFFPCVGEVVQNEVRAPYRWFLIETPDGDYIYHDHWDPQTATGTFTGQTTGTVWTRVHNGGPFVQRTMGGGMVQWAFHGWFVSETGPDLQVHEVYHASRNADGELVAEHYSFSCEPRDRAAS